ncbi:MAG: hypothetical protein ABI679_06465 [Gemmatimonadota bacterium]
MAGKFAGRRAAQFAVLATLTLGAGAACDKPTAESNNTTSPHLQHDMTTLSPADVQVLRHATNRFHTLDKALNEGYAIFGGCFADSTLGGMGQHYANDKVIGDSAISLNRPELLLYETDRAGQPQLVAVEYIVFVDEWLAKGHTSPPRLFNTDFHINSTLLPKPFYLLHAWVWKENPSGLLSDWNPRVSCN